MSQEIKGTLSSSGNLVGHLDVGGGGTDNYPDLNNLPQINGVTLIGNKTTEDIGIDIPAKTSDLENDSGFITSDDLPTKVSDLENDSGFITDSDLPTKVSDLENDTGFITSEDLPTKTSELDNDSGFITGDNYYDKTEIDTALSGKADKSDTYTKSQVDTALSSKANASDTYTKTETDNKIVGLIDDNSTANNKAWSALKIGSELSGKASTGDLALKADKSDTYTKAQTDSAIVGLIDDTTTANNKAWSSSKITDEIINILPTGTASGSVASFNTSLALPLVSAKFAVNASQESGTPTPSTPKAISGWSAVNVTTNGDTETINLDNTCYGGEITQDNDGHRQFTNYFSSLVNLNSFDWYKTTIGGRSCFYTDLPSGKKSPSEYIGGKCSTYTQTTSGSLPNDLTCKFYSSEQWNFSRIAIRDDSVSGLTGEQFKAYVSGSMCYEIATPTTTDLPNGTITTISGANSISADSGDTEVVYKESINDAIAELQALFLS